MSSKNSRRRFGTITIIGTDGFGKIIFFDKSEIAANLWFSYIDRLDELFEDIY